MHYIITDKLEDYLKVILQMPKDKQIDDVLKEFIEQDTYFEHLEEDDKIYMYSTLKKILKLIHLVLKYPNVCPILFVHTPLTKRILEDAFYNVAPTIPTILNIKIEVMQ